MAHSSVSLSKTRPPPLSGWRASAANFRRFAVRNQAALALAFVLCGTAACLLIVESEEQYTDPVTLVTRSRLKNTSFVSQIRKSLFGFCLGIFFILVAIPIIVSTEFRAVRNWKILVEVEHKCRKILPDEIHSALDGKLIHFNGPLTTKPDDSSKNVCRDTQLNVSFPNALHVYRKVEMMQWKRKILRKTSTNEDCIYMREWSDSFDDNSEYNANCTNPQMRVTSTTVEVPVRLGAFTICPEHLTRLTHKPNPLSSLDRAAVVAAFQTIVPNVSEMGEIGDGDLILAQHPESSEREIGDYRITYFSVDQGHEMSIVGMQNMKTVSKFIPVYNSEGGGVMLIKDGIVSPHEMVAGELDENEIKTSASRGVCLILCWFAFALLLHPVCMILKFIPALYHLCGMLAGVASFLLGLSLFLLTVAVSWFLARPLLVFSLVGTGVTLWTAYGTPEMHEAWVFPAWIGVMVLIHGSIAGWNYYIKDDPERTPLLT